MKTNHKIYFEDSRNMEGVKSESVDLMITSPPYPMIKMWDSMFSSENEEIKRNLEKGKGGKAFDLMHQELNKTWGEVARVLKPGGIACVNIGDATRKIDGSFQLFSNHTKVIDFFKENGFRVLPEVLWRKPTNSITKFMGSGMLPTNAYVTLEHEHILIFRKGKNRRFETKSKKRYNSAYFWEERNKWFSDVWMDIKGALQELNNGKLRQRAAAYPVEIPYRLINMYSIHGDTVLDPFWGTGTTTIASIASGRNSIGYEIESDFMEVFKEDLNKIKKITDSINRKRLKSHLKFTEERKREGEEIKYDAKYYNFPVITKQERRILLLSVRKIKKEGEKYVVKHEKYQGKKKDFQTKLNS